MTPDQTDGVVKIILACYTAQRLKMTGNDVIAMTEAYGAALGDLDYAITRRAVSACVKTYKFIPTIAEIRQAYADVLESDARERSKRELPVVSNVELDERSAWARMIVEQLDEKLTRRRA